MNRFYFCCFNHPLCRNRYERVVSVFSRAGFPTEHLRADFISEKVSGIDVSKTMQPRFGAAVAAAAADVTALLNDSDFDETNKEEEAVLQVGSTIFYTKYLNKIRKFSYSLFCVQTARIPVKQHT